MARNRSGRDERWYPRPRLVAALNGKGFAWLREEESPVPRRTLGGMAARRYVVARDPRTGDEVIIGLGEWERYVVPTRAQLDALG